MATNDRCFIYKSELVANWMATLLYIRVSLLPIEWQQEFAIYKGELVANWMATNIQCFIYKSELVANWRATRISYIYKSEGL